MASPDLESSLKTLTVAQESSLGLNFYILILFSKSGEGVVATATTTYGYDYMGNRVSVKTENRVRKQENRENRVRSPLLTNASVLPIGYATHPTSRHR